MKLNSKYILTFLTVLITAMALSLSACGEPDDPLDESLAPVNGAAAHEGDFNESELIVEDGGQVDGLQVIYEKVYTMKTYESEAADNEAADNEAADSEAAEPGVTQEAVMLMGVKNNSESTLDFTFKDKGKDKDGNKVTCRDKTNIIYAVGPGETRYFQQRIKVEGDDAANIDHMSGDKNRKRFKVTNSQKTSYKDQISITDKVRYSPKGVWHIFAANNSEYTGDTEIGAIFLKDGEPVYFSTTPLCNMHEDGSIAWLGPGESTENGTFLSSGGNKYDKVYLFVIAHTTNTQ